MSALGWVAKLSDHAGRTSVQGVGEIVEIVPYVVDSNGHLNHPRIERRPLGCGGHRVGNMVRLRETDPPAALIDAEKELGLERGVWYEAEVPRWSRLASGEVRLRKSRVWVRRWVEVAS